MRAFYLLFIYRFLRGVFRHDDPHHDVWYESWQATGQQQYNCYQAHNYWVDIEIFCYTATYTGNHAVLARTVESFWLFSHSYIVYQSRCYYIMVFMGSRLLPRCV